MKLKEGIIISERKPRNSDNNYDIGETWYKKSTKDFYVLIDKKEDQAIWAQCRKLYAEIEPFWIKTDIRDLTLDHDGGGTWNYREDIQYFCEDGDEKEFDLSQWFYDRVEKLKKIESKGEYKIFQIKAYPSDQFHHCSSDCITISEGEECDDCGHDHEE